MGSIRPAVEPYRLKRGKMDKLSEIMRRFSISAGVVYSGQLCGVSAFGEHDSRIGHFHLLKQGCLTLSEAKKHPIKVTEPSLLFYPRPTIHSISATLDSHTEIVCASVHYGTGSANLLSNTLPDLLIMPLSDNLKLQQTTEWLFDEAFKQDNAKDIMMDRLSEILLIQLIRHLLESGQIQNGMLAGLSHPQLGNALNAMHHQPDKPWTLQELASLSNMSRSKFADLFRRIVGNSAGEYLIEFRIELAKSLLKKDKAVGLVANEVGYETASALARVFRKKLGVSPLEWLQSQN